MAKALPLEEKLRRQEQRKAVAKAKKAANNRLYRRRAKNRPCPHCSEKDNPKTPKPHGSKWKFDVKYLII